MSVILTITITALVYSWMLVTYYKYDANYDMYKKQVLSAISNYISLCSSPSNYNGEFPRYIVESVDFYKRESYRIESISFDDGKASFLPFAKVVFFGTPFITTMVVGIMLNWNYVLGILYAGIIVAISFGILTLIEKTNGHRVLHPFLSNRIELFNSELNDYNKVNVDSDITTLEIKHSRLGIILSPFNEIANEYSNRKLFVIASSIVIIVIGALFLFI